MKCVRCHRDNPSHAKFCLECGTPFTPTRETGPRGQSYEDLQHALTEALQQQTATADVLKVISRSAFDLQTVLDTLCESAVRLCDADHALLFQREGEIFRYAASFGLATEVHARIRDYFKSRPVPVNRGSITGRAALEARVVQVADVLADTEYAWSGAQDIGDWRAALGAPLLREGRVVGVIFVAKTVPQPFTDKQIELIETFANQAVIAIENVRLFNETKEALDQQTATGEVLRVIASSPTDLQPVFDTIAESAARLCGATDAAVRRVHGEFLQTMAVHGPAWDDNVRIRRDVPSGRAVLDAVPIHIHDIVVAARDDFPGMPQFALERGVRTMLAVPLLREGVAIGVITIRRQEVRPFADKQIALLQTFADQAVIAIENVRLFKELEVKNRDLTEALEQQTATSEILRVISSSPTDVQPVFDTIVQSAARLCGATRSNLVRFDGELLSLAGTFGFTPADVEAIRKAFPPRPGRESVVAVIEPGRESAVGRAVMEGRVIHIPDVTQDPQYRNPAQSILHLRTVLAVPMLREGIPIGAVVIWRSEVRPFSEAQIKLVTTFAAQAVIAIENVRLFSELQERTRELARSVEELKALGEVGQAVSSTLDLDTVLTTVVARAVELSATDSGTIYELDEAAQEFELRATHGMTPELIEAVRREGVRVEDTPAVGRAATSRRPVQIPDIAEEPPYPVRDVMARAGFLAFLVVPMIREDRIIGLLVVRRRTPGAFPEATVDLLLTFAAQSVLAIQNARLFREIEDKSRQLEAASRHKSEFLANMSHELRTPMNAILGFSEVLLERLFGEVNAKQTEYLQDILASGQHLLSLINDILDLSKVEAGRLELELGRFHLPTALDNALTLVRERATRHGITLTQMVDERVGEIVGDERKVKQILLNLLSNAVKFTPEGGRVGLTAMTAEGVITISVSDTGVGIAPEDQAAIFEEFRQVGRDDTRRQEGTGLGLTLAKKFVELQGGRVWVQSQVGQGSTFTFTLPVRPEGRSPSDQGGSAPSRQ